MLMVKCVVHPTDFTEYSEEAHRETCAMAREQKAKVIFLHVAEKPVVSYLGNASELPPEKFQEKLWEAIQWPRESEAGLNVEHRFEEGDPVKQIVRVCTETNCDLVVMGTRGKTGISRWFTSSVAEEVVRKSPCSVLVVKPRTAEAVSV
jgi:universal stress protein A